MSCSFLDTSPTTLPFWMQASAFGITALLAGLKLFEVLRMPKLDIHLTRDLFFRLIDQGEALFCSAVLLASNGPILVREATATLKRVNKHQKKDYAEKTFPLVIAQHGEKLHGANVNAEHKFFGSSPLQYLEEFKPYRAIYLCFQREYQDRQKSAVSGFIFAVEQFRNENAEVKDEDAVAIRAKFSELIEKQYHSLATLIQLEAGDYRLDVNLKYQCVGWYFFGKTREKVSSVNFSIDPSLLERWKSELRNLLNTRGHQILTSKPGELTYPSLEPIEIVECQGS